MSPPLPVPSASGATAAASSASPSASTGTGSHPQRAESTLAIKNPAAPALPTRDASNATGGRVTPPEEAVDDFVLVPSPSAQQLRGAGAGGAGGAVGGASAVANRKDANQASVASQPIPVPSQRSAYLKVRILWRILVEGFFEGFGVSMLTDSAISAPGVAQERGSIRERKSSFSCFSVLWRRHHRRRRRRRGFSQGRSPALAAHQCCQTGQMQRRQRRRRRRRRR